MNKMKKGGLYDGAGSEWDETEHPRDDEGKFTSGCTSDAPSKKGNAKTQNEFFGQEFNGYKGQEAIEKLLAEKRGYIRGAFTRKEIGEIDLLWGDDTAGIAHIIKRREEEGLDGIEMVYKIPEIIEKGIFIHDEKRNRYDVEYNGDRVVIKPTFDGKKFVWIMTAMQIKKPLGN